MRLPVGPICLFQYDSPMPRLYGYFGLIVLCATPTSTRTGACAWQVPGTRFARVVDRSERRGDGGSLRRRSGPGAAGASWMRPFDEVVMARADDMVAKWIDLFVMHRPIKAETITRGLK